MAFTTAAKNQSQDQEPSGSPSADVDHGVILRGILRRVDERTVKKGDRQGETFRILQITAETGRFELFEVLDFSNARFQIGGLVSLPVSASARVSAGGFSSVSWVHRDRNRS